MKSTFLETSSTFGQAWHQSNALLSTVDNEHKLDTYTLRTSSIIDADLAQISEKAVFHPPASSISMIESFAARGITDSHSIHHSSSFRTFVYGPPQSGKTSLAMDFAHSLACQRNINGRSESIPVTEQPKRGMEDCSDCNVLILRHQCNNVEGSDVSFPMKCFCNRHDTISTAHCTEWNEEALDQITILHLESYSDLIKSLASVQWNFPNISCLIIDDLHLFLPNITTPDNGKNEFITSPNTSTSHMIVQILALAVDTCNFLQQSQQRQQQVPSIPIGSHLLITMNETFFPGTLRPILFNWMKSILHITKDNGNANGISAEAYPSSDNLPIGHYTAFWECIEIGIPPTMGNPQRLSQKAHYTIQPDPKFSILGAHNVHIHFLAWTIS